MISLAITQKISMPQVWQMYLYIATGANSHTSINTGGLVTCVKNLPNSRGVLLGLFTRAEYGGNAAAMIFLLYLPLFVVVAKEHDQWKSKGKVVKLYKSDIYRKFRGEAMEAAKAERMAATNKVGPPESETIVTTSTFPAGEGEPPAYRHSQPCELGEGLSGNYRDSKYENV
ncbi:hypothetical protein FEM48_Zijuj03G0057500 [Ziziphus jujuba var. spinosa]|uniref:Nodulin-like domain-containing protein n=1 Tax=Ziziphus jujuba var. spinosa TaxID=714518 RepID=A0A978VNI9_ZIZJJ|nr:hypothetical protein FEM48_Zijuj03G0057500 [Ziziphus jujuba var. spinosa]